MHKIDIEKSLRKINSQFVQNLSEDQKHRAAQSFKKMYAEEMQRASGGINRKKKIQTNLQLLEQQKDKQKQIIEEGLNKRFASTEKNRAISMENKMKQHRLLQENWKRRWEEIASKRKFSEAQSVQKAEKIRKQTQEFFSKRRSFFKIGQTNKSRSSIHHSHLPNRSQPKYIFSKGNKSLSMDREFHTIDLPSIDKKKQEFKIFDLTDNTNEEPVMMPPKKYAKIKFNHQKFQQINKEKQSEKVQKMINKYEKIEKNRQSVLQKREQAVKSLKRARQLRQDPQKLARNRQRSLQDISFRRRDREDIEKSRSKVLEKVKPNLDASIHQHIEAKKSLEQYQFNQRGQSFQRKFQRLKRGKIQKILKDAVLTFKHQVLKQRIH